MSEFDPVKWAVILGDDYQIVVGELAGIVQAISIPMELDHDDKAMLAEWKSVAEHMLYRVALFMDGYVPDMQHLGWIARMLGSENRRVMYCGAFVDVRSHDKVMHWFVIYGLDGRKRRVVYTESSGGEHVMTIVPHDSDFEFLSLLKRLGC